MVLCHVFGMNWYEFARVCIRTYMLVFHRELTTDVLVLPLGYLQVWYVLALPPSPPSFPPPLFLPFSVPVSVLIILANRHVRASLSLPSALPQAIRHGASCTQASSLKPQASSLKPQPSSLNPQKDTLSDVTQCS